MIHRRYRLHCIAIAALSLGMLGFAIYYLQGVLYLDPCPMCILQRYAFIALALVASVAAIHNPEFEGRRRYAIVLGACALAGGGVALRHAWLQWYPSPETACRASDLDYLLNTFPLAQALPKIFAGTGECADVKWRLLGLSIPEWALAWFVAFALMALFMLLKPGWYRR